MNEFLKSILDGIYSFIGSYGWSVVAFTVLIRLVLMPLDYKSRVGMRKMTALAPKQAELQKKYGHDQEKLQRKMQELYKKEGASPLSGCWPMLLTMPIMIAMFTAMRYMANEQLVQQAFDILISGEPALEPFLWVKNLWMPDSPFSAAWPDFNSLRMIEENQWLTIFNTLTPDEVTALASAISIPDLSAASFLKDGKVLETTIQAIGDALTALPAYAEQTSAMPYMSIDLLITKFTVVKGYNGFFILPVLSAASQFLMTKLQEMRNPTPAPTANANGQQQPNTNGFMKWFFPLFSLWICAGYNAAFAVYWVTSNLIHLVQNELINWYLDRKDRLAAQQPAADAKGGLK